MSLIYNMLANAKACAAPSIDPAKIIRPSNLARIHTLIQSIIAGELPLNPLDTESQVQWRSRIEGYAMTLGQGIFS
jgi:hypothetical protein